MIEELGSSLGVFIGLTVILLGGGAFLMGQALARDWQSFGLVLPYTLLLALTDRFLVFALFGGELTLLSPLLVAYLVLLAMAALGYRLTLVDGMIAQYPWLYERDRLFTWRERTSA